VLNELLLDFNALNKVESLPWDGTELCEKGFARLTESELTLLDRIAGDIVEGDAAFERIRGLFKSDPRLRKRG
jgi:hypothetical protein